MTTATWIEMIVLFVVLAGMSYGKRKFGISRFIIPIVVLAYFAHEYIKDIPTNGNNIVVLVLFIVIGAVLGGILSALTKISKDDGAVYLKTGIGSVIVFAIAFLIRIIPIEWMTHHELQTMHFAIKHQISIPNIIGPAFIFLTAVMVLVRIVTIVVRVRLLPRE
ncbi:hypothetical protein [Alicyclobacillus acidiphilus]|uniref:hypothetical protein n=1 Tax=Alicyclobacillus acidiphilus TaxID=182455 RepID=UPI00083396D5|nr:hypothetical protein [Alicyclobacillus acidiphilus]